MNWKNRMIVSGNVLCSQVFPMRMRRLTPIGLIVLLAISGGGQLTHALDGLTRIIGTGDPIPESQNLTAGLVFRHPKIHRGEVAFFTEHEQFGVDKPSITLLHWNGSALARIADSFTPVPGVPGAMLEFNDLLAFNTLSIDVALEPTIVFYASHSNPEDYALYRWRPATGIQTLVKQSASIRSIQSGVMVNGTLVFRTWPLPNGPELWKLAPDGTVAKILEPGDEIVAGEVTVDFIQPDFLYNGERIVASINTKPSSRGGWWNMTDGALPTFQTIYSGERIESPDYTFWSNSILNLSPAVTDLKSTVGRWQGVTSGGSPAQAVSYQKQPGAAFEAVVKIGDPVAGAVGFSFMNFFGATVRGGSIIFAADARNSAGDEIIGLYQWGGAGATTLIDTRSQIDGKQVTSVLLHDCDRDTRAILFTAYFDDDSAGLFTLNAGSSVTFEAWTEQQFPDANGNQAIIGDLADPEKDGLVNIVEFALGGKANVPDSGNVAPTVAATTEQGTEFEFQRRKDLPDDFTVVPEISSSLSGQWQSGTEVLEQVSVISDPNDPEVERVRVRTVGPMAAEAYLRILVRRTP